MLIGAVVYAIYSGPSESMFGTLNPLQPSLVGSSEKALASRPSPGEFTGSLVEGTPPPYNQTVM